MQVAPVRPSSSLLVAAAFLISGLFVTGCGGGSSTKANNTPSAPPPSTSQPGPGSTGSGSSGSGSGSGGSSGGNSATSITGTVINSQTGAPVTGTVAAALEGKLPNSSDYGIAAQTSADTQGHFRFDNAPDDPDGWTIAVSAKASDGTVFAPTFLVSGNSVVDHGAGDRISPGVDVGTITLVPSPTATITATVTSQNAADTAQPVNVVLDPFTVFFGDRNFSFPWVAGPPKFATGTASCGLPSDACAQFAMSVPTANAWWAVYNHNGNQFQQGGSTENFRGVFSASSITTGQPDCNPSQQTLIYPPLNSGKQSAIQVHFQSCTP